MIRRLLFAAILALAPIAAAFAEDAPAPAACTSADATIATVTPMATANGYTIVRLDGVRAARFMDYVNHNIGDPSDWHGRTVLILKPVDGPVKALVMDDCEESGQVFSLSPAAYILAIAAADASS